MICLRCKSKRLFQYNPDFNPNKKTNDNTVYEWKCLDCNYTFKDKDLKFIPTFKFKR